MRTRVLVWGLGKRFFFLMDAIKRFEETGQIEIVALTARDLPPVATIYGWPVLPAPQALELDFDYVLGCMEGSFGRLRKSLGAFGAPLDRLIPSDVLRVPGFSFERYLIIRASRVSIVSNNCWGGFACRTLAIPALTPFKNLFVRDDDYLRLIQNVRHYVSDAAPIFAQEGRDRDGHSYPVMLLDDVYLHFNHASSAEEASRDWMRRRDLMNWDNLFFVYFTFDQDMERRFSECHLPGRRVCLVPYETRCSTSVRIPWDEQAEPFFYNAVNQTAQMNRDSFPIDLFSLLLGDQEISRCTF